MTGELERLRAGSELVRVHHSRFAPAEFNAPRPLPVGPPVIPTLYAARDDDTAIAEALFHDVPLHANLARAALAGRVLSRLAPTRELRLIRIEDRELIEAPASAYVRTSGAAEDLHAAVPDADGIVWASRRAPDRPALVLFGDRIADLTVIAAPVPLDSGPGLELAEAAAMRAGVGLLF